MLETVMVTEQEIDSAATSLRKGELVAFPTETVYGVGANALDALAVAKIFELKQRPRFDPLIVHVADAADLRKLAESVPQLAQELIEKFWPGPLSLVLKKLPLIPDIVTSGLPSVAIRCPAHDVAQRLLQVAGIPVAAPSANRFGMVSPTIAAHVTEQFGDQLPIVLDDGPCRVGVESTVISFVDSPDGRPVLLRPGGIPLEQIESVTGPLEIQMHEESRPTSPGQLLRHYSPATALYLSTDNSLPAAVQGKSNLGLVSLQAPPSREGYAAVEVLSETGCLREAAANLFAALRRLDALGLDLIVAQPVPEIDLGRAIMDRLRRAAAR